MNIPRFLKDYLNYMSSIKGNSQSTIKEYKYDLQLFLQFIKYRLNDNYNIDDVEKLDISDFNIDYLNNAKLNDMHSFISYLEEKRNNGNFAKFRKVASIRSLYDYLFSKVKLINSNVAAELEFPKTDSRLPLYLTLSQSEKLLNTTLSDKDDQLRTRDYAIIFLFLNCGLRLSELSSINIDSLQEDLTLKVIGKGNKERTIFLNNASYSAIKEYIIYRPTKNLRDEKALFISKKYNRMSNRAIQYMVERRMKNAGIDTTIYSVHKLRHTSATLMYKYGNVDIRTLQEILGHSSVATTQIYTHLDNEQLKEAVDSNPLSNFKSESDHD